MRVEKSDQVFPWEKYFTLFKIAKQDFIEPPKNISPSSKSQNSLSSKLQNKIHSSSENLTCTVSSPLDSTAHWASHLTTKLLLQCYSCGFLPQFWISTLGMGIYLIEGFWVSARLADTVTFSALVDLPWLAHLPEDDEDEEHLSVHATLWHCHSHNLCHKGDACSALLMMMIIVMMIMIIISKTRDDKVASALVWIHLWQETHRICSLTSHSAHFL